MGVAAFRDRFAAVVNEGVRFNQCRLHGVLGPPHGGGVITAFHRLENLKRMARARWLDA